MWLNETGLLTLSDNWWKYFERFTFYPSLSDDVMQNRHLSTAVNSDLTQIESFFNAYFPLNTVDRIRKIDIIVYHWNGQYLNIQCTAHLLLSSHFRLFCSFVLFRKAKRALRFCAYLIFVIFFIRAKFLENKIYTEKRQFFALNL